MTAKIPVTEQTRVRRLPKRGVYDRQTINSILDEAFVCHVGFVVDGQPYVIPTGFARIGDDLYIHGSSASRMLRSLAEGIEVTGAELSNGLLSIELAHPKAESIVRTVEIRTGENRPAFAMKRRAGEGGQS